MLKRINPLICIVYIAFFIRLLGVDHGFPFIFHVDEPAVIRSALGIRFNPNPEHFDWPHLYFYLNFFVFMGFSAVRRLLDISLFRETFPLFWDDELIFYLLSRIFSAFIGALTLIPVYLSAKNLFNKKVAVLAALFLCFLPHHVRTSQFALLDVPMLFFFSWGVYFCTNILVRENLKDYLLAGLSFGLAASTKYNGALGTILVPLSHFIRTGIKLDLPKTLKFFIASGLLCIFGFILGTPYSVLDYDTFIRTDSPKGALWQFTNVGKRAFPDQVTEFFKNITTDLPRNFGFVVLFLFFLSFFVLFFKLIHTKKISNDIQSLSFLIFPGLFYMFYISGLDKDRGHYFTFVYGLICIAAAYTFYYFVNKTAQTPQKIYYSALIIFLILLSFKEVSLLRIKDTRVVLYERLQNHYYSAPKVFYKSDLEIVASKVSEEVGLIKYKGVSHLEPKSLYITDVNISNRSFILLDVIKPKAGLGPKIFIYEKN